jgi:hypothetical protein
MFFSIRALKRFLFVRLQQVGWRVARIGLNREYESSQWSNFVSWHSGGFKSPAPNFVKWEVLTRWGSDAIWIETGTYLGETTDYLSKVSQRVISIEPSIKLVEMAKVKFKKHPNVSIVQGTSQEALNETLPRLTNFEKRDINFWLDGHYSEGITFLGEIECPVLQELDIIQKHLNSGCRLTILIDDVRMFSPTGQTRNGYPSLTYLSNWADNNCFFWTIEHDIFIMTNRHQDLDSQFS